MRYVSQPEAKRGKCIDTCDTESRFRYVSERLEMVMARTGIPGSELVYTIVPIGHCFQWQIYLVFKEHSVVKQK